jgi:hypothetical protein
MKLILIISILVTIFSSAFADPANLQKQRVFYKELLSAETNSLMDNWNIIYNKEIYEYITNALKLGDSEINQSIISYLNLKASRYFSTSPLSRPEKEQLKKLANIAELKSFLFNEAKKDDPIEQVFPTIMVFYGEDDATKNEILSLAKQVKPRVIIASFLSVGAYTNALDEIVIEAIKSNDHHSIGVAATYLKQFPIESVLPHLMEIYANPPEEIVLEGEKSPLPNATDIYQMLIGSAILSYQYDQLLPYKTKLLELKVNKFGSMSKQVHNSLTDKVSQ